MLRVVQPHQELQTGVEAANNCGKIRAHVAESEYAEYAEKQVDGAQQDQKENEIGGGSSYRPGDNAELGVKVQILQQLAPDQEQ